MAADPADTTIRPWWRGPRLRATGALLVGVVLWFVPTLLMPVLGGPIDAALRAVRLLPDGASAFENVFAAGQVLRWLAALLLILFVVFVEREQLSSIGIRPLRRADALLAVLAAVVTIVVGGGLYLLMHGPGFDPTTQHGQLMSFGVLGRLHIDINAAVVEEFFFRGLLIERLIRIFGRPWLAGSVSFVLFVGSHYLSGSASLVETLTATAAGGLAFVLLYLRTRNVIATGIAHAICDLPNVVLA